MKHKLEHCVKRKTKTSEAGEEHKPLNKAFPFEKLETVKIH